MSVQSYDRRTIALTQLETALRLFEEGQDLFSVITLAGAAEEILGQLLKERGETNSLESRIRLSRELFRITFGSETGSRVFAERANRAKNAFKHHAPGSAPTITCDVREEAIDILDRAISNYWRLEKSVTPRMKSFTDQQRAV